jgi:hypothetical protein
MNQFLNGCTEGPLTDELGLSRYEELLVSPQETEP